MGDREELQELRRLAELEAKAGGGATATTTPDPGIGNVMMNAVPKGVANLVNTPVTLWNLAKQAAGAIHPQIKDYMQPTPNYPMQAAESLGLVDPAKNPQTAGQRIADAAVQGGVGALAGPGGFIRNAATGMAAGGVGQTTTEVTGSPLAGMAAGALTPFALRSYSRPPQNMNPVREQTFREGRQAGYVVPPTRVNPSFMNERLESIAGKAAVNQEASARNQQVTNALAARDIGLPPDTPLSEAVLGQVRQQAGQPYRDIANISPQAGQTLEALRDARHEATAYWNHYNRTADPQSLRDARTYSALANQYEQDIANFAQQSGQPGLVNALAQSRTRIARTHDIERSLNLGSGDVSAPVLGRQLDQSGVAGRTGNLGVTGRMAQAFPQSMREGSGVPSAGVSGTDSAMSAGLGIGGYGAAGPVGIAAAGLPLVRGPARALALSNWNQNRLLKSAVPPEGLGDTAMRSALIAEILAARQQQGVQ